MKQDPHVRAADGNWKYFNSYERVDAQKRDKDRLASEVDNI